MFRQAKETGFDPLLARFWYYRAVVNRSYLLLDQQRYDCDNKKDCARTWKVKPTKKGSVDIIADAKDQNGIRAAKYSGV